jgi:thioredoxin-like negative regulator of GroEL
MLAQEPHDVFLRYGLALEMAKEGQHEESLEKLRELMCDSPPYVPAFFMSAQLLVKLGRAGEARSCLAGGIQHARQQGDAHAAREMSDFLAGLGEQDP